MRKYLLILSLLLAIPAQADLVVSRGKDELRLMTTPCVHGGVLGMLKPEWRDKFKKAQATVGGKMFYACWIDIPEDQAVWVLYEDGDGKDYPLAVFTESPGV